MFKLQGVVPPMITPFDQQGELDVAKLEQLVDFLSERVNGLFICGSYGSGPLMNVEERKKVAEVCVKVSDGRVKVIAHTGTTNTRDTVELARHRVVVDGQPIGLTPTESKLLHILLRDAGRTVRTEFLLGRIWPLEEVFDETLRVHVYRLRKKIEHDPGNPRYILTVRGEGYTFGRPSAADRPRK